MKKVVIGTRGSKLALWQARRVRDDLSARWPEAAFEVEIIKTEGDARHDLSPGAFGREGIFTAELDRALLEGRIDLAVHSLKDLPTSLPEGLALAAVTERASISDAFILRDDAAKRLGVSGGGLDFLSQLEEGLVVGTSSLRRMALLKNAFPRLEFQPLRGNLDTRVRKLGEGDYDAIVVAEAGLKRLEVDLGDHALFLLPPDRFPPAAGQGALAVESRSEGEARDMASVLDHAGSRAETTAERKAMSALGAGCRVPAGFMGRVSGDDLILSGAVGLPSGARVVRAEVKGPAEKAMELGRELADMLLSQGARDVLEEARE